MVTTIRLLGALLVATALLAAACGGDDDAASATPTAKPAGGIPPALTTIKVQDNKFTPSDLQVPLGVNITWDWTGSTNRHSVKGTFDGQPVESPVLSGTGVFLFAFQKSGTFEYECGIHGAAMKGSITIH